MPMRMALLELKRAKQPMRMNWPRTQSTDMLTRGIKSIVGNFTSISSVVQISPLDVPLLYPAFSAYPPSVIPTGSPCECEMSIVKC